MNMQIRLTEPDCEIIDKPDPTIPDYMHDVYQWAYLDPFNARLLDHEFVVSTILWGNSKRLRQAVLAELAEGDHVLQAAHVYGKLIPDIAKQIGPTGFLDVIDVTPVQVALCKKKTGKFNNVRVRVANATTPGHTTPGHETYDIVNCFFLLHEVPDALKRQIVDALLSCVAPGGKAIFVDYHSPRKWHPMRGFMKFINRKFEPFAESLWYTEIEDLSEHRTPFQWNKRTLFGGLYQITIATLPVKAYRY